MSDANLEKDLNATGDVFKYLHGSMKTNFPVWEDFIQRGQRFQRSLEQLIVTFNAFLDGFSRLADTASNSKGGTQEMGNSLTNLVRWHKAVELKIREINYSFSTKLLTPVSNRVDEWKKSLSILEKDHDKEMSRSVKDTKEVLKGTIKAAKNLESKRKKDKNIGPLQQQYEALQTETDQKIADTELKEKVHMSRLMVEERVWFATLSNAFKSVLDNELTLTTDLERLPELVDELKEASSAPSILPEGIRDYIENWQIPPVSKGKLISQPSQISLRSNSFTSLDSPQHYSSELNISAPVPTLGPTVGAPPSHSTPPPSLSGIVPPPPPPHNAPAPPPPPPHGGNVPPPPNYPPPSNEHQAYIPPAPPITSHMAPPTGRPLPEDTYDVPVPSAYVSVSPSQVSLVSNGSHNSGDSTHSLSSTHSSTRSASPPYSHLASHHHSISHPPNTTQYTPTEQPPYHGYQHQLNSAYFSQAPTTPHQGMSLQQELFNKTRPSIETDLERPFARGNSQVESTRYIPATLPRPKKTPPVQPKPSSRNSSGYNNHTPHATPHQSSIQDDDEDDDNMSAFAQALRKKQLRKAATISDRSAPKMN